MKLNLVETESVCMQKKWPREYKNTSIYDRMPYTANTYATQYTLTWKCDKSTNDKHTYTYTAVVMSKVNFPHTY